MLGKIWKIIAAILNFFKKVPPVLPGQPYVVRVTFGETEDGRHTKIVTYSDGRTVTSIVDAADPTAISEFLESMRKKDEEEPK